MGRPIKLTVDYFPHFTKHGKTIFVIESQYGNDGYAVVFKLLEELSTHQAHFIDFRDKNELLFFMAKTRVSGEKIELMLNLLAELDFIDRKLWENKVVWCQGLVENLSHIYAKRKVDVPQKPVIDTANPVSTPKSATRKKVKKESKESKEITSEPSSQDKNDDVNKIIDLFYEINPGINYGNKTNRKAVEWFIKKYGFAKAKGTAEYAISIQGKEFAPTITTPYQLKEKLGALLVYEKQKDNRTKSKGINIGSITDVL